MLVNLTERVVKTARAPEDDAPLLETALAIAAVEYPGLDTERYRTRLDHWADTLLSRLPDSPTLEETIQTLNDFLFSEQGFVGNRDDYYDPRNSFINDVLDRKLGIPLTLSIIYIELGRRLGLPFKGVCFPGHFLVKLALQGGAVVLDPFNGGISLSEEDLGELLQMTSFESPTSFGPLLAAAPKQEIIVRLLRNLKVVYQRAGQLEKALEIVNLILAIDNSLVPEYRDRGLILTELDCNHAASRDLVRYLAANPTDEDAEAIRALIDELAVEGSRLH